MPSITSFQYVILQDKCRDSTDSTMAGYQTGKRYNVAQATETHPNDSPPQKAHKINRYKGSRNTLK